MYIVHSTLLFNCYDWIKSTVYKFTLTTNWLQIYFNAILIINNKNSIKGSNCPRIGIQEHNYTDSRIKYSCSILYAKHGFKQIINNVWAMLDFIHVKGSRTACHWGGICFNISKLVQVKLARNFFNLHTLFPIVLFSCMGYLLVIY